MHKRKFRLTRRNCDRTILLLYSTSQNNNTIITKIF